MIGIDTRCPRCRTDASRQIVDMGHERPICSRDAMSAPPPIATGLPHYGGRRQGLTRRLVREREQAPPLSVLQIFRSVVDDPVARAAPGARRHHHRSPELHRRPEPESADNNPLKRNGAVNQQRRAARATRAGRSASELAGDRCAPLARLRAAKRVDAGGRHHHPGAIRRSSTATP
jgi:hypothetical protein